MGFFDNIMGGKSAVEQPTNLANSDAMLNVGGSLPNTGMPTADLNNVGNLPGNIGGQPQVSGQPQTSVQTQDEFASLWEPTLDKEGKPIPASDPALSNGINFNLDVGALDKHYSGIDFTKGINTELFNHVAAGGEQALAALPQIINHAVRQAVLTSAQGTARLVQGTVQNADTNIASLVQAEVKKLGLQDTVRQNPVYSNPLYAPVVSMVQQQVLQKYPNATQADLSRAVDSYFKRLGSDLNPGASNQQPFNIGNHNAQTAGAGTDWTQYFTG